MLQLLIKSLILLTFSVLFFLSACGGSDSGTEKDTLKDFSSTRTYKGAGSNWEATFNPNGGCSLKESHNNITVDCQHKILTSGFREITISSVSGSNTIAVNDKVYALELEKYAFIMASLGSSHGLIPLIGNTCPSKEIKSNYIHVYTEANELPSQALPINETKWTLFGTYDLKSVSGNEDSSSISTIETTPYKTDGSSNKAFSNTNISCNSGTAKAPSGNNKVVDYYFNKSGLTVVREGANDSSTGTRMFGIPEDTSGFEVSSLPSKYIGFMGEVKIDEGNISQNQKSLSISRSNSELSIKAVNPANGSELEAIGSISIRDDVLNTSGVKKATIRVAGKSAAGACVFDTKANNKTFIACAAFHPVTNNGLINFIFASK